MKKAVITVENDFFLKKLIQKLMEDNVEYEKSETQTYSIIISFESKEELQKYVSKLNPLINGFFFID